MKRLLIVHHTPSPAMQELLEAAIAGATTDKIVGVDVVVEPALTCPEIAVLEADGYLLGTPANIGYMSGALKHFFDRIYYPCLHATVGRPFAAYVHGASDTAGAARAIDTITTGLKWARVAPTAEIVGPVDAAARDTMWELAATAAVSLTE